MYKCSKCEKNFEKYKSLSLHSKRTHGISIDQFYVDYYLEGKWPVCKCGCGEKVKWSYVRHGFSELCHGHYSRIHNNWGHNPKAIENSSNTRREQYASGDRTTWNTGLTIEDPRVKKNIDVLTDFTRTPEERKIRSDRMRENRLNGTVPTLHGPDHSQWKGGVSEINVLARARKRLYTEWKYPILVRDEFKCVECGKTGNLHVHHDKEQMCEIVARHIVDGIDPQTFEEKEFIADAVVEYHIKNSVSGVTLCEECHGKIHPFLNFS